jgi:hypothetical protein
VPVKITKLKNGKYKVATPNGTHAKSTTKAKAEAQRRLLNAVEHGWHPTHKKAKGKKR